MTKIDADYLKSLDGQDRLAVSAQEGFMLMTLVKKYEPLFMLEVGTGHGYSSAWMSMAMKKDATLFSVDFEERPQIKQDERFVLLKGTLVENEEQLPDWLDFIFLDSDHQIDEIASDIEFLESRMHPGTVVVVHDTIYCDEMGRCLQDYLAGVESDRLKTIGIAPSNLKWSYEALKTQYGLGVAILGEATND